MRKAWNAVAVYFGFREPDSVPAEIRYAAPELADKALGLVVLAGCGAALAIVLFDWGTGGLIAVPIGVVVFGLVEYFSDVQHRMPADPLLRLPDEARISPPGDDRRRLKRFATTVPLLVPFLWGVDALGGDDLWVLVIGQFLGMALANLVGLARLARWERAHGSRIAARTVQGRVTALYATRTVTLSEGASRPAIGSASDSSGLS